MTTTRSRKQTSHAAFSCPTHLMALHGFNFSQQHIAEPVTNAAAWFSCTPWQIFNEDLQAKGCIVGEGVDGLTWFIHRKPSAFQGLHETAAGSISTFCPLPESNTELYCYFPHKLFPLHMLQSSFVFSTSRWTHLNEETEFHHHSVLIAPLALGRDVYLPHKQPEATFDLVTLQFFSFLWQSWRTPHHHQNR